jgi:hypothetical protein
MAKRKSTKHTYKTKDRVTRTPLKTGGELMCSGKVSNLAHVGGWFMQWSRLVKIDIAFSLVIDMIINFLWKIFHKPTVQVDLTTTNFGGFSNFCRYYTRSQTGKSTRYRPNLKPRNPTKNRGSTHVLWKGKQPGSRWRVIRAKKSHCEDRHRFLVGWKIFHKPTVQVVLTTTNFGGVQ